MPARLKPSNSTDTTFIYALLDPRTREIRYIGKADRTGKRLCEHQRDNREQNHKARWVKSLIAKGLRPILQIIDEVKVSEWQAAEAAYIIFYKEEGCSLTNSSPGGDGSAAGEDHPCFGKQLSLETIVKLRAAWTPERRARMSAFAKRKRTPEWLAHNREAAKNRTPEHQNNINAALKGRKAPNLGIKHSDATRSKISAANKGEKHPNYGKKLSATTRAKMSAIACKSQKKRRERERLQAARISRQLTLF